MSKSRSLAVLAGIACGLSMLAIQGCEEKPAPAPVKPPAATPKPDAGSGKPAAPAKPDEHDHKAGDGHDHDHDHDHKAGDGHDHDDHGPTTQLGEQTVAGYTLKVSRGGDVTPGSEASIDLKVTGGAAKISAVRCWIGTQDAKGSMKAKAEIEKDGWHSHVEVPKPLPEGSRLWVELETDKGEKHTAGFELKA